MTTSLRVRLLSWVQALTPRERTGLALLAAAASLALALFAFDSANNISQSVADLRQTAQRTLATRAREENPAYRKDLKAAVSRVEALTIREQSEGVAQARAVSAVRSLALDAGLANVVAAPAPSTVSGSVTVTLSADFTWSALAALLDALGSSDVAFGVEEVVVSADGEAQQTMVLRLSAPFVQTGRQT